MGHESHSHLSDFRVWEVTAAAVEYSSRNQVEDFDTIGMTPEPFGLATGSAEYLFEDCFESR